MYSTGCGHLICIHQDVTNSYSFLVRGMIFENFVGVKFSCAVGGV